MSGAPRRASSGGAPAAEPGGLPPLVLRARWTWKMLGSLAALYGIVGGTDNLARGMATPQADPLFAWALPLLEIACGAWLTWGAARYAFSRLVLDERGFALRGPLGETFVPWRSIVEWRRRPREGGIVPQLFVLHGADRRLLWLPLIYEDAHAIEVGVEQRGFPRF